MYRDKYNIDVLLFFEHRDRELEVIIEIAKILKYEYGLSVAIASTLYDRISAPLFIIPKVIVFNSDGILMSIFYAMYKNKVTYVNLNWEQMLSAFNKRYRKPRSPFSKSILKHCAWGENFKAFLKESGVNELNIFVTGKPSITLLRRKALNYIETRNIIARRFGLDKSLRWVFFPMTCLHAFFDDYHVKSFINDEIDEETAFERRDYVSNTLNVVLKWIALLEQKIINKNFIIIMRPHPAVSISQYKERFNKVIGYIPSYVYLYKDLTAHEWLVASDVCYTNYSSLALDAYSIGKPAYILEPAPFPHFLIYDWLDGFYRLKTQEDFCLSIEQTKIDTIKKSKVVEDQYNLSLEGIKETTKLLARFAKERLQSPKASISSFLSATAKAPRLIFGSLFRLLAMELHMSRLIKPGIVPDFVDSEEIKRLLR
jgi:surface carbohydrate biosynthesis protein